MMSLAFAESWAKHPLGFAQDAFWKRKRSCVLMKPGPSHLGITITRTELPRYCHWCIIYILAKKLILGFNINQITETWVLPKINVLPSGGEKKKKKKTKQRSPGLDRATWAFAKDASCSQGEEVQVLPEITLLPFFKENDTTVFHQIQGGGQNFCYISFLCFSTNKIALGFAKTVADEHGVCQSFAIAKTKWPAFCPSSFFSHSTNKMRLGYVKARAATHRVCEVLL